MKRLTKKAWFGPKRNIGWGWAPASWEGWVTALIYLGLIVLSFKYFPERSNRLEILIGLTVVFAIIILLTGDKPGGPKV